MKYEIDKKILTCSHCGNKDFESGEVQLNTALMTFFDLDWLNKSANIFICKRCGKIEWFLPVSGIVESDDSIETDCLSCGGTIPAGDSKCAECGWTYKE